MATNSASSNPIGVRTGAVTDSAPAVSASIRSEIKSAAAAEIVASHRLPSGSGAGGGKEDGGAQKAGSGVGDEVDERTK